MSPIVFSVSEVLGGTPTEIARQILDLSRWPQFKGYGPIPGIATATFDLVAPELVGTRILVTSTDGSTYVEEIAIWQPESHVVIHMKEFSPPLANLATSIIETWEFDPATAGKTTVKRSFELFPKSLLTKPALYLISVALKQAIIRHLRQLKNEAPAAGDPQNNAETIESKQPSQ
jgi:hypothetical protein